MFRKHVLYGALACAGTLLCSSTYAMQPSTLPALSFALSSVTSAATVGPVPQITRPIDSSVRTTLAGNTNSHIVSGALIGALADDTPMDHMLLSLQRSAQSEAAMRALIDELHDPKSPKFHHWLTPDQFGAQFGPAADDIAQVTAWLESNGFVVNEVARGGTTIDFSGTAAQVNAAFQTSMQRYSIDGVEYISNDSDPNIPSALAPVVVGIVSLNNAFKSPQMHRPPPAPLLAAAPRTKERLGLGHHAQFAPYLPAFTYVDPNGTTDEDVAPGDFNMIYNVNPAWSAGYRGAGQSVWVLERTRIAQADWNTWRSAFGLSGYAGTFVQTTPSACTDPGQLATGDQGEAALDAEWASAAAPDANIVVLKKVGDHVEIENNPVSVKTWRVDQILSSELFGLESARPPEVDAKRKRLEALLLMDARTPEQEAELERLDAELDEIAVGYNAEHIEALDFLKRVADGLKGDKEP